MFCSRTQFGAGMTISLHSPGFERCCNRNSVITLTIVHSKLIHIAHVFSMFIYSPDME